MSRVIIVFILIKDAIKKTDLMPRDKLSFDCSSYGVRCKESELFNEYLNDFVENFDQSAHNAKLISIFSRSNERMVLKINDQ